jgi:hypothetical protein
MLRVATAQASTYAHDPVRAKAVREWAAETTVSVRIVTLLAWVKPAVLGVLRSNTLGLDATRIPVPPSYPGWRWMWIGDGVVTVACDAVQLGVLLWTCYAFNEPVLQLGVRESCLHAAAVWAFVLY